MKNIFLLCSLMLACQVVMAEEIRVAAAANLRYVMPEIAAQFELKSQHHLAISYAASGTLATQIQHGAPFKVFLSASPSYIDRLIQANFTDGKAITYAQSQLALFAANHSNVSVDKSLSGLKQALMAGSLNKVAIANPRHAPYGQAAQAVLERYGLWQDIQPYLLKAENASQVMQFSLSSSVDIAFVPYGHIVQPYFADKGQYSQLDYFLPQQAIQIGSGSIAAGQFLEFLQSTAAQSLFKLYGFKTKEQGT